MARTFVLVSGYTQQMPWVTGTPGKGIYILELDSMGQLTLVSTHECGPNVSYLCSNAAKTIVYACCETEQVVDGKILAFKFDKETGRLSDLNQMVSQGSLSCYVALNQSNDLLFSANYGSGSVTTIKVDPATGKLLEHASFYQLEGFSMVNKDRQEAPHAHHATLSPDDESFLFVPDLGADKIVCFQVDHASGTLSKQCETATDPGSGPRHIKFHPTKPFAFANMELSNITKSYKYDPKFGALLEVGSVSTLPEGYTGETTTAALRVSDDGKNVFVSNRGLDAITQFKVDQDTGMLTYVAHHPTNGEVPRDFYFHNDFALIVNQVHAVMSLVLTQRQDSGTITVFKTDFDAGKFEPVEQKVQVQLGSPSCVLVV